MQVSSWAALKGADNKTFRQSIRGKTKAFYQSIPRTSVATNGRNSAELKIDSGYQFIATGIVGVFHVNDATRDVRKLVTGFAQPSVQITDEGSGQTWFNRAMRWDMIVGVAQRPGPLQPHRHLSPASLVRFDFENFDSSFAILVDIGLWGFKVYLR